MGDMLIKNGLIVTGEDTFPSDLLIVDGAVARIGRSLEHPDAEVIDAKGLYVMPGGVDAHTHLNLTVGESKVCDGFYEGSAAAAFGGVTCIVEHPSFGPAGCSLLHQVQAYREEAARQCVVDFGIHGVFQHVTPQVLSEIPSLMAQGVPSAKVYLTYEARLADREILQILEKSKDVGLLPAFHAENHEIIEFLTRRFKAENKRTPEYHPLSRPGYCEAEAIYRLVAMAEAAQAPIYIVHLSTLDGLRIIEAARDSGLPVYCEVCPQHLLLDDTCYKEPDGRGLRYVMAPPARKAADRQALWHGLAQGSIDVVATDHCSFSFADKLALGKNDFSRCPGGIPGVETRLPLLFSEGVLQNRISLNRFVELVSTAPAKLMGLFPRKGNLAPGADGDVIVFDPDLEKQLTPENLRQNADYSPFEGRRVRGWPVVTIVRGRIVVQREELLAEKGWGEYVHRRQAAGIGTNQGGPA